MSSIKILMLVPVYRRPDILAVFIRHMERTRPPYAELRPVFVVSEEDPDFESVMWQVRKYDYLIYKNFPLGEKMNAGVRYAMRFEFDYLMNIGSDNVWTMRLWSLYEEMFYWCDMFGINDFHAYRWDNGECKLVRNYNSGFDDRPAPIGAGRMIKRACLDGVDELYRPEWNWGMDGASMFTLWERGVRPVVVETNGEPVMMNIMTRTNLTQWEELKGGEAMNYFDVRAAFGLDGVTAIDPGPVTFDEFDREVARRSSAVGRRAAFDSVNEEHRARTGEYRYKNFQSFTTAAYKRRQR